MSAPLVSVICLCYNHGLYIREAVESVIAQTYSSIQIIIVDDASTDKSATIIRELLNTYPQIEFLQLERNVGNCAAFNRGLSLARGEYIVDFATDDVFMPSRIEKQVNLLHHSPPDTGVVFTDAEFMDEQGRVFRRHFDYLRANRLLDVVPQGDVYKDVLSTYFICAPTMLVRRSVFDYISGYDEQLAYEDFDFWVRSSRRFRYLFIDEVLTKVRRSRTSLSTRLYKAGDRQLYSTYLVCRKALELNRTPEEDAALLRRLRYELRHAAFTGNKRESKLFAALINKRWKVSLGDSLLMLLAGLNLPLQWVRSLYQRIRYR